MQPILSFTMKEIPKICRVCFSKETIVNILDTQYKNISMRQIFLAIFYDKINEDDKGPVSLCGPCLEMILNSYELLMKYENSQTILKHLTNLMVSSNASCDVDKIDIDEEPLDKSEINDADAESIIEAPPLENDVDAETSIEAPHPENDANSENDTNSENNANSENDANSENNANSENDANPENNTIPETLPLAQKDVKSYMCGLCDYDGAVKSRPRAALKRHYLSHHLLEIKTSTFFCVKCNEKFPTLAEILEHTSSQKHQNKQCPICSKTLKSLNMYHRHVKNNLCKNKYFCHLCQVDLPTFNDALEHFKMKNHVFDEDCMLCSKAVKTMFIHIMKHRPKQMPYACIICLLPFANEEDYKQHRLQTDHSRKQCWVCKKFIPRKSFSHHLKKHTGEQIFTCEACGKVFTELGNLTRHYKTAHEGMRFYCDKCTNCYTTARLLKIHIAEYHDKIPKRIPKKAVTKSIKRTICELCGKEFLKSSKKQIILHDAYHKFGHNAICRVADCLLTFPDADQLKLHMENEHTNFFCEFCQRTYYDKLVFERHLNLHIWKNNYSFKKLPPDQQICCRICDQQFQDYQQLAAHLKQKYELLMCTRDGDSCLKVFSKKNIFYLHTLRHDERPKGATNKRHSASYSAKERRFSCDVCLNRFRTSQQLIRHSRIHTGERPFGCRYCEKHFNTETVRRLHERLHTGEKPYSCSHCGRRFIDCGHARKHEAKCQINQNVDKNATGTT